MTTTGPARILAFAGSARAGSLNARLLRAAADGAREAGAEVTLIDLRDYPMPIYDGDLEAASGLPEAAKRLKALMKEHHGFLIASPEYNSALSPLLKNVIDWCSRSEPGEQSLAAYRGKVAGLIAASGGALGGLRGLVTLRMILGNIGVHVLPNQFALPKAHEAFGPDGAPLDEKAIAPAKAVASELARVVAKLK